MKAAEIEAVDRIHRRDGERPASLPGAPKTAVKSAHVARELEL